MVDKSLLKLRPSINMDFLPKKIDQYVVEHSEEEPKLLQQLNKETWQKVLVPRMLSGHYQGRLLAMLSKLAQPKSSLEIGTYTGYSALCLAEGLDEDGILHTIDHNEELVDFQKKYFDASLFKNQIKQYVGNALDIIPKINESFDLVFIDADKSNYINYYNLVFDQVTTGGYFIFDNVLWSGKVLLEDNQLDEDTLTLKKLNQLIQQDNRIENLLLPVRDGLMLARVL